MHRLTILLTLALTTAATTAAKKSREISWGRADVPFAMYRTDAIACGRLGANVDIADQPATAAFVAAERLNDRALNAPLANADTIRQQAMIRQRLSPEKRIDELQNVHLSATERCLTRLGYRRFVLTKDQARALRRFQPGTAARHAYLHALASDATVLVSQAMPATDR